MADCETCGRWFVHGAAAAQHMNALNHWAPRYECETCDDDFSDEDDCNDHMDQHDHWAPKFSCEACRLMFHTRQQARRHMDSDNHWRAHWCGDCQRGFPNANNLQQHVRGAAHRGASMCCPFCRQSYTTASGIAHHLERGSCPNATNVNRESIHKFLSQIDKNGSITNKQIAWHSEQNSEYSASNATWNGRSYECYLCHRQYKSLAALNQHLSSAAHKQKIYHCFGRGCTKQFTTLAALFNHLESESCGATRFEAVQSQASAFFTSGRMITL